MIEHKENVILFGLSSSEYSPARHYLEKYNVDQHVLFIVDNNPKLAGKFQGTLVRPQSALNEYIGRKNISVVITATRSHMEIKNTLLDMGFSDRDIIIAMFDADFYSSCIAQFYINYSLRNPAPVRAHIELSRSCNCRCLYCPIHGAGAPEMRKVGFMDWETLKVLTQQIAKVPTIVNGYFCGKGETYLHPEWYEMIKYVLENTNIRNLLIYSNGMLLTHETVHKLAKLHCDKLGIEVSIDGETPEENDLYRTGSNYELIRENIYYAAEYLARGNVAIQILNTHPVSENFLVENDYIVGRDLQTPSFIKQDFDSKVKKGSRITFMPLGQDVCKGNGVTLRRIHLKRKDISYPPCTDPFDEIAFTFAGDVVACSCDMISDINPIINVLDGNSIDAWTRSGTMKKFRNTLKDGKIPVQCAGCGTIPDTELDIAVKI